MTFIWVYLNRTRRLWGAGEKEFSHALGEQDSTETVWTLHSVCLKKEPGSLHCTGEDFFEVSYGNNAVFRVPSLIFCFMKKKIGNTEGCLSKRTATCCATEAVDLPINDARKSRFSAQCRPHFFRGNFSEHCLLGLRFQTKYFLRIATMQQHRPSSRQQQKKVANQPELGVFAGEENEQEKQVESGVTSRRVLQQHVPFVT